MTQRPGSEGPDPVGSNPSAGAGHASPTALVLGGLAYILAIVGYAVAQVVSAAAWHPSYSWKNDFISDLGNTACGMFAVPHGTAAYVCSPRHDVMNASFVVAGVLTVAGTLLLRRSWWPARRLTRVGLALLLVSGVLKVLVGFAPENTSIDLHLLGAFNLPLQSVAILLLSLAVVQRHRAVALFGLTMAVVGLIGSVLSTAAQYAGSGADLGIGNGGMERLAGYPGNVWLLVIGGLVLRSGAVRTTSTTRRVQPVTA